MANSECKKCHKPLVNGNVCDMCKQKSLDRVKKIAIPVTALFVAGAAIAVKTKSNDDDDDDDDDNHDE